MTINKQKEVLNKVNFLSIDTNAYHESWHSTLHSHPFTELFYVTRGSGFLKFKDQTIPIQSDDLIIINPYIDHTEFSLDDDPLHYIVIGLDGIQFTDLTDTTSKGFMIQNYQSCKRDVFVYIQSILEETYQFDSFSNIIIKNLLTILVANIIRQNTTNLFVSDTSTLVNHDCLYVKDYLKENFQSKITLDDLANITYLNKFYLSHIFKKETGLSPIEYLLQIRLKESKKLLKNTDLSMAQIANIVGFGTPSYFAQYFKKHYQQTPSEYKKTFYS